MMIAVVDVDVDLGLGFVVDLVVDDLGLDLDLEYVRAMDHVDWFDFDWDFDWHFDGYVYLNGAYTSQCTVFFVSAAVVVDDGVDGVGDDDDDSFSWHSSVEFDCVS